MIRIIVITVIVILAGIVVLATTRPDNFRVERSTRINAPPEKVLPLINDFHQWSVWSPF
ncbi:MAG: SRPBCC family protein, partial [Sinobacteraceae bacterium]|nr:SRPBCC family protein [Nevskiaceae bacterium]